MSTYDEFVHFHARRTAAAEVAVRAGRDTKRAGAALLASRYGILDPLWIPSGWVYANGHPNPNHIDGVQCADRHHRLPEIPHYGQIATAVTDLCTDGNSALKLRSMGIIVEDKSLKRISAVIRGCVYALTLFHLWSGDDVRRLRFKTLKRKSGPVFVQQDKWRHHSVYRPYWPAAWEMHSDGTRHADCLSYLHALCMEYRRRSGHDHNGYQVWLAVQSLLDEECSQPVDVAI